MNVLLIEPDYKNKYPPLGLMKLSTYHKEKGDTVVFFKGNSPDLRKQQWDRIYITTLFTFYWKKTIETIDYYSKGITSINNIYVGGILATLQGEEIKKMFNVNIVKGLLNQKGKIGFNDDNIIDEITPDYSIIDTQNNHYLTYDYPVKDCYFVYASRGCIRKCPFCAVPKLEPDFISQGSIKNQIIRIKDKFGEKKNLMIMDNNILADESFENIIKEIKESGFAKGDKYNKVINGRRYKLKRVVDFNQGIDSRLLDDSKMKMLSELSVSPLRIAFDNIKYSKSYMRNVRLAAKYKIPLLSNYILFNYEDTPQDFYERLTLNIDLNEEFENNEINTRVWSFPMKYMPIFGEESKHRKYIGIHWNKKYLRAIQCILSATHGVVGNKRSYFNNAFGSNYEEFIKILYLPDNFIINRSKFLETSNELNKLIAKLSCDKKLELDKIIFSNNFNTDGLKDKTIIKILSYYE